MSTEFRIGQGFDVHRLVKGRPLILGGVHVPSECGLLGHSDADVLLHALMDALLGASGKRDIGQLFPSEDERWKGVSSLHLLKLVWDEIGLEGWQLGNADCYVIAEAPRLSGHFSQMKTNIAGVLNCSPSLLSVRATTSEGLGFPGRSEGMLASAVVLLRREVP